MPTLSAILVYLMPLNFTFLFLFYTETASLATILILYYMVVCKKDGSFLSNVLILVIGIYSLLMRQTNIIYANYVVLLVILRENPHISSKIAIINNYYRLYTIVDPLSENLTKNHNLILVVGHPGSTFCRVPRS